MQNKQRHLQNDILNSFKTNLLDEEPIFFRRQDIAWKQEFDLFDVSCTTP